MRHCRAGARAPLVLRRVRARHDGRAQRQDRPGLVEQPAHPLPAASCRRGRCDGGLGASGREHHGHAAARLDAGTIKVGDELKVSGQVGRNGAKKLYVRTIVRPDGSSLMTGRGDATGPDPNQVHATPGQSYGYGRRVTTIPPTSPGLAQQIQMACDRRRPRAEADAVHGGRPRACSRRRSTIRIPRCAVSRSGCRACSARPTTWRSSTPARTTCSSTSSTTRRGASGWTAEPAARHAARLARLLGRPLGGQRARHRDDASAARLARRLGFADEGRGHAHRRALRVHAPIGSRWIAR